MTVLAGFSGLRVSLFLDKAGAFSYTSSAVRQQCLSILADGGASVPLDQPEVWRITVPFIKPD
jgi:hypothetical protein